MLMVFYLWFFVNHVLVFTLFQFQFSFVHAGQLAKFKDLSRGTSSRAPVKENSSIKCWEEVHLVTQTSRTCKSRCGHWPKQWKCMTLHCQVHRFMAVTLTDWSSWLPIHSDSVGLSKRNNESQYSDNVARSCIVWVWCHAFLRLSHSPTDRWSTMVTMLHVEYTAFIAGSNGKSPYWINSSQFKTLTGTGLTQSSCSEAWHRCIP